MVVEVLNGALSGDNSLNKEAKHGEHSQAAILDLLHLQLSELIRIISQSKWVKSPTGVKWVKSLLVILIITKTNKNYITSCNPNLLVHLTTDVAETLGVINTHGLTPAITKHAKDLGILLPVFLEDKLTLLIISFILSPLPVLSSLSLILRHGC